MGFKEYIKNKKVVKSIPDTQKVLALQKMSKNNFLVVQKIHLDKNSASIILSQAYESLRQILEAIALSEGYKIYSHEAYTDYLLEKGEIILSNKFDRLRKLRNGINYYGKPVSENVTKAALKEIKEIIKELCEKYL
ncbi:hypothetical protein K9L67_01580 [Candidatus Woesearchaeota archaeon]|nr:hypothetical protein [Candidatus Woesearchaeota archaeon]MCF7900894.1 hypothetical protein [Candidatus Woesearchaeota archaeon]MCF8013057.1 hypothetical protein [Candidatus Woesearchaeota archaeon]